MCCMYVYIHIYIHIYIVYIYIYKIYIYIIYNYGDAPAAPPARRGAARSAVKHREVGHAVLRAGDAARGVSSPRAALAGRRSRAR